MIEVLLDIECPKVPNFVRVKGSNHAIPICDLNDAAINKLAALWLENLKKRAAEQKATR